MKNQLLILISTFSMFACQKSAPEKLYQSPRFSITKTSVVQGENVATVLSPTHIISNYKSPVSSTFSRLIKYKFSINEKDNELPIGVDHWVIIQDEKESPIITFGEQPKPLPDPPSTYLPANYSYTFRVDISPILTQFAEKGYYETFNGTKIAEEDFKGVFLAGGSEPLTWDFVNLDSQGLKMQPTEDPAILSLTITFNPYNENDYAQNEWTLETDVSSKPNYQSDQPIVDALFNLSLEEAIKNIEPDSTLRTGAKWGGVWTRDVSYSILLAFAYHEPEVAKISLRKKVKRGRIIQDTGSGGAWPISSDRTTWVLAAWEIYKVTGDTSWLDEIYPIVKNTLEDDYKSIFDPKTGMYSGESSFLDWREQTYPKWMDNKDIFESLNLGTNAVHYQAHIILSEMAKLKGEDGSAYLDRANRIKEGMNTHLWMPEKGYYGQYLYGRSTKVLSPRYEALGEALSILFEVADPKRAQSIMTSSPLTPFGATCIYPQIPGIPPYHNNGIWPFVQAYWNWAAAKSGNEAVLTHGLASIYRAAALFLTNYENMVAETGDFLGTEINSHRMLWSMAGNLAMVHRVFMGLEFKTDGLYLSPVVPSSYTGIKTLSNFKYRNALLDITVHGHGNTIRSVSIDGQPATSAFIPADWSGKHSVEIQLDNQPFSHQEIQLVANTFSLPTVQAQLNENEMTWVPIEGASRYQIYKNGEKLHSTIETHYKLGDQNAGEYTISAIDKNGYEGFMSEPIVVSTMKEIREMEDFFKKSDLPYSNYSGNGFIELNLSSPKEIVLPINVKESGTYIIDFRYSNGNGRWNTDNKCAIRSLTVNDQYIGVMVFPQRGMDEWSDWGYTNPHEVYLKQGTNKVKLHFEEWNNNMNVHINSAMVDHLRLIKKQ